MKKFIHKILLVATAFIVGMGFTFMPIAAHAEEVGGVAATPETVESAPEEIVELDSSVELPETSDNASSEEIPEENADIENSADESGVEGDGESSVAEELIPESEGSKWFDEYIMPILIGICAPLAGTITGGGLLGWILFKGTKLFKSLLGKAIDGLTSAKDQTDKASTDLLTTKDQLTQWQEAQNAFLTAFMESQKKTMQEFTGKQEVSLQEWQALQSEMTKQWETRFEEQMKLIFKQLQEVMASQVTDTNTTVHKLLEVEKIVYGDNPVLVSNGTAKKVAEVVRNEN